MRRKKGAILPLEAAILAAADEHFAAGLRRFHGFLLGGAKGAVRIDRG